MSGAAPENREEAAVNEATSKFGTSQSVLRKEDGRFLTGEGRFLDDAAPEGALHAVFLRSPVAHARRALDRRERRRRRRRAWSAVFTARDLGGRAREPHRRLGW